MPLTAHQEAVLAAIWRHRDASSHLAGAAAIHASEHSIRFSGDLDFFHASEVAVAEAFGKDRVALESAGFSLRLLISQPGFIRSEVVRGDEHVLVDWAHDSAWRFMPTVRLEGIGHVLHPVDLAVNKVLALAGRDEPRDWVDALYLDRTYLSLGAMIWAATGKDPGMNPSMLLEFLGRKGRVQQRELDRLILTGDVKLETLRRQWIDSLEAARAFVLSRPPEEAGHLYVEERTGRFFTPHPEDAYRLHAAREGGVLPRIIGEAGDGLLERGDLEQFFARRVL